MLVYARHPILVLNLKIKIKVIFFYAVTPVEVVFGLNICDALFSNIPDVRL